MFTCRAENPISAFILAACLAEAARSSVLARGPYNSFEKYKNPEYIALSTKNVWLQNAVNM